MEARIIRGVRVALPEGIAPASVHIREGKIAALAGYEDVPRTAVPDELGKSVLMPALAGPSDTWTQEKINELALLLSETWTKMRESDQAIEGLIRHLCHGQMKVGASANFVIWNPELVVIGSQPARYGQLRQLIVAGQSIYKDGALLAG
jgi:dihydroorotase-like cyclic amidohydrolase